LIPILDQSLDSPFEVPSPPHEGYLAISSEHGVQLDGVIERIERINLDGHVVPYQSMEKLDHHKKF